MKKNVIFLIILTIVFTGCFKSSNSIDIIKKAIQKHEKNEYVKNDTSIKINIEIDNEKIAEDDYFKKYVKEDINLIKVYSNIKTNNILNEKSGYIVFNTKNEEVIFNMYEENNKIYFKTDIFEDVFYIKKADEFLEKEELLDILALNMEKNIEIIDDKEVYNIEIKLDNEEVYSIVEKLINDYFYMEYNKQGNKNLNIIEEKQIFIEDFEGLKKFLKIKLFKINVYADKKFNIIKIDLDIAFDYFDNEYGNIECNIVSNNNYIKKDETIEIKKVETKSALEIKEIFNKLDNIIR